MNSMGILTTMLSNAKNPIHEQHLYDMYYYVNAVIDERVPEMIRRELNTSEVEALVKVKTQLNGKDFDIPQLREYIQRLIAEEIRKALKNIKI